MAAQIAGAQAQLQTAQINLGYTEIRAPIDGKISATEVTEGNVVSPTSGTLANLVSQDPMYVLFPVSVRAGLDLRNRYQTRGGFSAVVLKLRLPDGRIYGQEGKLDYVSPTVATNTDTITVRGVFPNPLFPGVQANAPAPRELFDGEFVTVLQEGVQPIRFSLFRAQRSCPTNKAITSTSSMQRTRRSSAASSWASRPHPRPS